MGFLSNLLESGISMASNAVEKKTAENLAELNPKEMSYAIGLYYYLFLNSNDNEIDQDNSKYDLEIARDALYDTDEELKNCPIEKIIEFAAYAAVKFELTEEISLDSKELPRIIKQIRDYIIQHGGRELCVNVYIFLLKMHFSTLIVSSGERTARLYLFKKSLNLSIREHLEVALEMQLQFGWESNQTKINLNRINRSALYYLKQNLPEYRNIPNDISQNTPETYLDYKNENINNFDDLYSFVKKENDLSSIDMEIKILTFLFGRRKQITENEKELINSMTKADNYDIDVKEKIHQAHQKISRLKNSKDFFVNNGFEKIDNDTRLILFVFSFTSIFGIFEKNGEEFDIENICPQYIYNLYLIQKYLGITYKDKMQCFKTLSERKGETLSQDEFLNIYDLLVSDEKISKITQIYPEVLDGYPLDFKIDLEDVFKNLKKQLGKKSELVYLAYKSTEKLAQIARNYAKNATIDEKPILIFDNSIFENCKNGFLLTDKHIYAKNSLSFRTICLNLSEVNDITYTSHSVLFNTKEIETEQIGKAGTKILFEFINYCMKNINRMKNINIPTFEKIFN